MKTWVKLYTETNRDPKIGTLSWAERGIWAALLALAGEIDGRNDENKETGELDTLENVAWRLRCDVGELRQALEKFSSRFMVDEIDGILFIHDYQRYCPTSGSARSEWHVANWRDAVFERDHYTCQKCGAAGGMLNAHHIKPWFAYPNERYDLNNGVTLCKTCHHFYHRPGWKREFEGGA